MLFTSNAFRAYSSYAVVKIMGHVNSTLSNMEKDISSANCISIKTRSGIRLFPNHSILSLTDCNTPMTTASGINSFNKPTSFLAVSCSSSIISIRITYSLLLDSRTNGMVTLNVSLVCSIVTSFCHRSIQRSERLASPIP